jgi:uncharacterized protein (DUF362 family)
MSNIVSIQKTRGFEQHDIKKTVYQALESLHFEPVNIPEKVCVKVNLCYYWDYSTGMTTDRRVVSSTIDYIRERWNKEAEISLVESDASAVQMKYAFKMLGYQELAEEKSVRLCNLSEDSSHSVTVSSGAHTYTFEVPETVSTSDVFISIPKPKYHSGTLLSCALKNQFGCNPKWRKIVYHPRLDEVIVGLNKIMKPDLILADGIIVCGDHPQKLGLILAGTNPLCVDFIIAKIMGLNPHKIGHINLAEKEKIGVVNDIVIVGEEINVLKRVFPKQSEPSIAKKTLSSIKGLLYSSYLKLVDNVPLLE